MTKLNAKQRNAIPTAQFAGPDRSYPIEDASHAQNAIARASQQVNAGNLSPATAATIKSKARSKLSKIKLRKK